MIMGLLQAGRWVDQWYDTKSQGGEFKRQDSNFRQWISHAEPADGQTVFKPEAGRYRLYVSLACPWAHRTLIFRSLKQLEDIIDVVVVEPLMLENGWELSDPDYDLEFLYQLYLKADPSYEGRVTVPVLWDKHTKTIVSNESAEIIRMFNQAFNHLTGNSHDYYPVALRTEIDAINERVYEKINNGVYRAGFATTQKAYETAYFELFEALDWLESKLSQQRYLLGEQLTEADWRLFTTLIRFDAVYHGHFKTNRQRLADYPALSGYVRELYQIPGVAATVNFGHIKTHYYASHTSINPSGVVPVGPGRKGHELDFEAPHNRQHLPANQTLAA